MNFTSNLQEKKKNISVKRGVFYLDRPACSVPVIGTKSKHRNHTAVLLVADCHSYGMRSRSWSWSRRYLCRRRGRVAMKWDVRAILSSCTCFSSLQHGDQSYTTNRISVADPYHFDTDPDWRNNPNQRGIGGKPPTFVQNDFTPWCLKLNIFLKIWYGSQIVWPFFLNFIRTSK